MRVEWPGTVSESDSFEMMVNVEKDLAKQKAGGKYCRYGK